MTIRCATASAVKLDAVRDAVVAVWGPGEYEILGLPVELQARPDFDVNAQPIGMEQTLQYARERRRQLRRDYGPGDATVLDISIESGFLDNMDVVVAVLYPGEGDEIVVVSDGIEAPAECVEDAVRLGLKTTTVGDVIHRLYPQIPANDWQGHFPPFMSRRQQISQAVERGLQQLG